MIIDEGVFQVEDDETDWTGYLIVRCEEPAAAMRALQHAAPRLQRVLWGGREVSDDEWSALEDDSADWDEERNTMLLEQVCEYVSEPELHDDGASVYLDTQSELDEACAATFFQIITDELTAEGVEAARIAVYEP